MVVEVVLADKVEEVVVAMVVEVAEWLPSKWLTCSFRISIRTRTANSPKMNCLLVWLR